MGRKHIVFLAFLIYSLILTSCVGMNKQLESLINSTDLQDIDLEATSARAQIITRAFLWIKNEVPYDIDSERDGYRTDCSGFVSYSWELKDNKGQPLSPDTVSLGNKYGTDISINEIQGGDIINNKRAGINGHAVIFVEWINLEHTKFIAFEENGGYGRAIQSELTIDYSKDGTFTILEYENSAPGPYFAQISPSVP